jgi:type II secretory pathway component PulK
VTASLRTTRTNPKRRGVALLLVLAAVVLIIPLTAGLARQAAAARLDERLARQAHSADSLRSALERGPLAQWLAEQSAHVVLPVEH